MTTLFYDSFQNTNNWLGGNSQSSTMTIKSDPLQQYQKVATFSAVRGFPDTFSTVINNNYKSFTISFDYLGVPADQIVVFNLGGVISISDGSGLSGYNLAYAGAVSNSYPPMTPNYLCINAWNGYEVVQCPSQGIIYTKLTSFLYLQDDSQWHHYSFAFTTNNNNIRLSLSDFAYASTQGNNAGDCYFANLLVTDSYGPSPFTATSAPENFRSISVDVLSQVANTVSYVNSNSAVTINLATGTASGGYAAGDSLNDIVNVIGSGFADTILGNSASNTLTGGDGDDSITAGVGNDILIGGNGADKFVITQEITKANIQDFDISTDIIDLRLFSNLNGIEAIKSASSYVGGDTIINLGNGKTLVLSGINYNDLVESNFSIITLAPTKEPTLSPSSLPTNKPTSPTAEPTTSDPSLAPTVKPSSEPTILPTVVPTLNPTLSPSNTPTIMPTTAPSIGPSTSPTALPTDIPTITPTLSPTIMPTALYSTIVDITTGGSYVGSSASENFIIDSPLAVIVAGGLGIDKFTIAPNPEVIYTIADFDFMYERIDLNRCNIHSKSDLGIATSGDFTLITLKNNNQQLKLLNVGSQDLAYGNFIFTSETNNKDSSSGLSQEAIIGIALGGSAFIGIGICALAYVNYISGFPAYNAVHTAKVIGDTGLEIVA